MRGQEKGTTAPQERREQRSWPVGRRAGARSQEKATPQSRLTHSPCAPGPRTCYGVRRQSIPGLASNWPTSCEPSFGLVLRSLAAIEGIPIARNVRAKVKTPRQSLVRCAAQGRANVAIAGCVGATSTSCIHPVVIPLRAPPPAVREKEIQRRRECTRGTASSWLRRMRSNGPPERRRSGVGKPTGWAQWIAPSLASVQGWTVDKPRSRFADSEGRKPGERRFGVAFSLVTLLLATQEKVTRSPEASEKRQGCRTPKERALEVQINRQHH